MFLVLEGSAGVRLSVVPEEVRGEGRIGAGTEGKTEGEEVRLKPRKVPQLRLLTLLGGDWPP